MTPTREQVGAIVWSVLLIISVLGVGGVGSVAATDHSQNSTQVDVDPSDLAGSGTEEDPYQITNVSELQAMEDDLDANYELASNIDASQTVQWNNGSGFDPIGDTSPSTTPEFSGSLDGNGYTITGLTINRPTESNVGLLGVNSGSLTDISLTNISVTGATSVGGVSGENEGGVIRNAMVSGSVNGNEFNVGGLTGKNEDGGTVTNATASASVQGNSRVGGLIGANTEGRIRNVTAAGSVNGTDRVVGGLVGQNGGFRGNRGMITTARATSNVSGVDRVGGLVGRNINGTITDVRASGNVSGVGNVGGLVGRAQAGTIRDAFATGRVSGTGGFIGGILGDELTVSDAYWDEQATGQPMSAGPAIGLTTAQMQGQAARTNMSGLDFENVWRITESYPQLRALSDQTLPKNPQPSPEGAVANLNPSDITLSPSGTTTVDLVVNNTGTIGAYEFNLTLTGASGVQIDEVTLNGAPATEDVTIAGDGRQASASAALAEIESSADSAATLGTVTISGTDAGNATLSAEINTLGDTQGSAYTIADPEATASITVANQTGPGDITGNGNPATDPDGDGVFEDVNGDGSADVLDVQALFTNLGSESVEGNSALDVNGDGSVDVLDVQALFTQL